MRARRARPSVNRTLVNACNQLINDDLPNVVFVC